jgi:hypothetical protein
MQEKGKKNSINHGKIKDEEDEKISGPVFFEREKKN